MNEVKMIVEIPEGTEFSALPETIQGLLFAIDAAGKHVDIPTAVPHDGKRIVYVETGPRVSWPLITMLLGGVGGSLGWTILGAQSKHMHHIIDADGNPVMEEVDGEQRPKRGPIIYLPLTRLPIAPYLPANFNDEYLTPVPADDPASWEIVE